MSRESWQKAEGIDPPDPQCGVCGQVGGSLFFISGGWGWNDDQHDGRLGLCLNCGQTNEKYREKFSRHFTVVSDSDSAHSTDASH
jgi:hypothetical protein